VSTATISILEALDDPKLFAPHFKGPSWQPWRAFLAALFGLPLDDTGLDAYRRHTGRTVAPAAPFSEVAAIVGRRGGKSRVLALIATYLAAFRDYAPYLAAGERATIATIAADRKQARTITNYIHGLFESIPALRSLVQDRTAEGFVLKNRVTIEVATASFRVTRGYSFAAVLCDETAFWRTDDDNSRNPDTEIFKALRPGLASIPGSMLLNASSPYRRTGELWNTFQRHHGRDGSRVLTWQATTLEMNPSLDPRVVEEAYEDDAESAESEFGALFRSDLSDFVSRAVVDACIERGCHERPPARAAGQYSAFIDAAGGSGSDSMTLAIASTQQDLPTLCAIREVRPPFSPGSAVAEFCTLMKAYGITRAQSDKWGGDWVGEAFRRFGITVVPSAKPKSDIYVELLPLLNGHRCQLLDHPRMVQQLCGLERRTSRSGKDSIDHGPAANARDDVANAVAGVLLMATQPKDSCISMDISEYFERYNPDNYGRRYG
jgi:hypothetical protein